MKIGIFGCTADPFHIADTAIVAEVSKKLDKVFIVPTVCNYYRKNKRTLFTFEERVRIIMDFITGLPANVAIDTVESDKNSEWRSINTVEYFKNKFPNDKLYFIMGEDSYNEFETWFRFDDILSMCRLMVINRSKDFEPNKYNPEVIHIKGFENVSSSKIREKLVSELVDMYLSDKEYYCV